ncbi:MAG: hypothetical protein RHS_1947 [Robinsoniella sp. RHS]|nr:MAG: hypothetical protein RHS_1947 [Robinsoniella sp. RHS]
MQIQLYDNTCDSHDLTGSKPDSLNTSETVRLTVSDHCPLLVWVLELF